jgi:hypothetical protein
MGDLLARARDLAQRARSIEADAQRLDDAMAGSPTRSEVERAVDEAQRLKPAVSALARGQHALIDEAGRLDDVDDAPGIEDAVGALFDDLEFDAERILWLINSVIYDGGKYLSTHTHDTFNDWLDANKSAPRPGAHAVYR